MSSSISHILPVSRLPRREGGPLRAAAIFIYSLFGSIDACFHFDYYSMLFGWVMIFADGDGVVVAVAVALAGIAKDVSGT